jgi:hypothetical protein
MTSMNHETTEDPEEPDELLDGAAWMGGAGLRVVRPSNRIPRPPASPSPDEEFGWMPYYAEGGVVLRPGMAWRDEYRKTVNFCYDGVRVSRGVSSFEFVYFYYNQTPRFLSIDVYSYICDQANHFPRLQDVRLLQDFRPIHFEGSLYSQMDHVELYRTGSIRPAELPGIFLKRGLNLPLLFDSYSKHLICGT